MSADSDRLFGLLATGYDEHFAVAHRRAYDLLAWEMTLAELPAVPATIVDVGCGTGRWARTLVDRGYTVVGVEPFAPMAQRARREVPEMTLVAEPVETAEVAPGSVDAVLAMGSLQYADDALATLRRVAGWLRPGGVLCLLVDSRIALGLELERADRPEEARERLATARAVWTVDGACAELRLFDRESMTAAVGGAGLELRSVRGVLIGASVWGRDELSRRLRSAWPEQLRRERALAERAELADLGKHLFVVARRPATEPAR